MMETLALSANGTANALHRIQDLLERDYIDEYYTCSFKALETADEIVRAMKSAAFIYYPEEKPKFFPHSIADSEKHRIAKDMLGCGDAYSVKIELRDAQWEDIIGLD